MEIDLPSKIVSSDDTSLVANPMQISDITVMDAEDDVDMENTYLHSVHTKNGTASPLLQDSEIHPTTLRLGGSPNQSIVSKNPSNGVIRLSYRIDDYIPPSSKSNHDLRNTFSWEGMLKQTEFLAAPVSAFRHAPMSDCWENIIVGMKVRSVAYRQGHFFTFLRVGDIFGKTISVVILTIYRLK